MASDKDSITNLDKPVDVMVNAQSVMAYKLLRAKAQAETAELKRRVTMIGFRPSHMYPNVLYHDGLRWACEYISGLDTLQEEEGTPFIAYGTFPEEAMQNFDAKWVGAETTPEQDEKEGTGDEDI